MRIRTLFPDYWILIIDNHSIPFIGDYNFTMRKYKVICLCEFGSF